MRSSSYEVLKNTFINASEQFNSYSLNDKNKYYEIVSGPAYRDLSPRTVKNLKKDNIHNAFELLADKTYSYIHNTDIYNQNKFNAWHKETCNFFIERVKKLSNIELNDGKAQKILNMTFKYLYCFSNSQDFKNKFEFCHMPLDSYTLNWFCDSVINSKQVSISTIKKNSWSNLEYGDSETMYSYAWIQSQIKNYLKSDLNKIYRDVNNEPLTPFIAEFYIWPEQKFKEACKLFENQLLFKDNYPSYPDEAFERLCENTLLTLSKVKNRFIDK